MPTLDELSVEFKQEMNDLGLHYHEDMYNGIVKHLGPSIHDGDANLVACSDESELKTIKENFLMGKLGLEDSPELDKAIKEVCHGLGESNRKKHRATFYYLLTAILQKESVFISEY